MTARTLLTLTLTLMPSLARASDGPPRPTPAEMERHHRLARTIGLAVALDLEPAEALQLSRSVAPFDERRLAAFEQMRKADEVVRQASEGDAAALTHLDQALEDRFTAMDRVQQIDQELLAAVGKGMSAPQRAKLAGFVTHAGQPPHGPDRDARPSCLGDVAQ